MSEQARETLTYLIGFVLSAVLTAAAFAAVLSHGLPRSQVMAVIAIAGIAQLLVHLRCFLHIDLSGGKREDLHLILFSSLLLVIMVGGTVWIMGNLAAHMH